MSHTSRRCFSPPAPDGALWQRCPPGKWFNKRSVASPTSSRLSRPAQAATPLESARQHRETPRAALGVSSKSFASLNCPSVAESELSDLSDLEESESSSRLGPRSPPSRGSVSAANTKHQTPRHTEKRQKRTDLNAAPLLTILPSNEQTISTEYDATPSGALKKSPAQLIAKPTGYVAYMGRSGYSLQQVLGWKDDVYHSVQASIEKLAKEELDTQLTYGKQSDRKVDLVCQRACQYHPQLLEYEGFWPIKDFLKLMLQHNAARPGQRQRSDDS